MKTLNLHHREDLELIASSAFSDHDVLASDRERHRRKTRLLQAMALEAVQQTEVVLTFETARSCKRVRSRIVAAGDDRIVLDRGITIPIHAIRTVDILS